MTKEDEKVTTAKAEKVAAKPQGHATAGNMRGELLDGVITVKSTDASDTAEPIVVPKGKAKNVGSVLMALGR